MLRSDVGSYINCAVDDEARELFEEYYGENYMEVIKEIGEEVIGRLITHGTVTLDVAYLNDKAKCDASKTLDAIEEIIIKALEDMSESDELKDVDTVYYYSRLAESCVFSFNLDTIQAAVECVVNNRLSTDIEYSDMAVAFKYYDILCFESVLHDSNINPYGMGDEIDSIFYEAYGVFRGYISSTDEDVLTEVERFRDFYHKGGYQKYKAAFKYINAVQDGSSLFFDLINGQDISIEDFMEEVKSDIIEAEMKFVRCIEF